MIHNRHPKRYPAGMIKAGKIAIAITLGVTLALGSAGTAQAKPPAPKVKISKHEVPYGHRIIAKLKIPKGYQAGYSWIHLRVSGYVHGKTPIMTGKNDLLVYEPGRPYTWKARVKYRKATQVGTAQDGTSPVYKYGRWIKVKLFGSGRT